MTETTETVAAAPAAAEPTKPVPVEEAAAEKPAENGHGDAAEGEAQTNGTNGTTDEAAKEEEKKEDPPKEMRSIVLTGFGGFKGVKILKKPEPTAQAGEVLIRVRAWWVIEILLFRRSTRCCWSTNYAFPLNVSMTFDWWQTSLDTRSDTWRLDPRLLLPWERRRNI